LGKVALKATNRTGVVVLSRTPQALPAINPSIIAHEQQSGRMKISLPSENQPCDDAKIQPPGSAVEPGGCLGIPGYGLRYAYLDTQLHSPWFTWGRAGRSPQISPKGWHNLR
jgi:hypothetical protein